MTAATQLTEREKAFFDYCETGTPQALDRCRAVIGRPLVVLPLERARVAVALTELGRDGIGRVQLATDELHAAVREDMGLPDYVAGR